MAKTSTYRSLYVRKLMLNMVTGKMTADVPFAAKGKVLDSWVELESIRFNGSRTFVAVDSEKWHNEYGYEKLVKLSHELNFTLDSALFRQPLVNLSEFEEAFTPVKYEVVNGMPYAVVYHRNYNFGKLTNDFPEWNVYQSKCEMSQFKEVFQNLRNACEEVNSVNENEQL